MRLDRIQWVSTALRRVFVDHREHIGMIDPHERETPYLIGIRDQVNHESDRGDPPLV